MRTAFINKLTELARKDKDIYLITADLGFSVFEKFEEEFKERFINVGIAEANMIGIAAGLAMTGKKVVAYSIIPFVTMRCFEQVRNDLCYQNLNVTLVGVGGGLSYGSAGATHHAIEDISIMRSLPNMKVLCPGDPYETEQAVQQAIYDEGPAYIRLNKNREPRLYDTKNVDFQIGKCVKISDGKDIAIIATGNMLEQSIEIRNRLENEGIGVKLVSMHTIKPIDEKIIYECMEETRAIFTIEEHNIIGGLGSAVAEIVVKNLNKPLKFKSYGIPDVFAQVSGSSSYFRALYKIDTDNIVKEAIKIVKE